MTPRPALPRSVRLAPGLIALLLAAAVPARAEPAPASPPTAPNVPARSKTAHPAPPHTASPQKPGQKPTPVVNAKPTPAKRPVHAKPGANAVPAPPISAAPPAKEATPAEPPKGSATGLALPRFAALRSDEVNLRSGPGTRYPIQWVYKRRDLPVEIEREFDVWRLIADPEGVKGWVHLATLTGRRSFVVTGAERTMLRAPDDAAPVVARLKPGVIGRLRTCQADAAWCQVQVGEYRGYLKRGEFWGAFPGEAVNP